MGRQISRRRFVGAASASAAAVMIVPRHVLGGPGAQAPSDTLNVAGIGVGGRGRADVRGCSSENVAALCDADLGFAARTFREFPAARVYQDYRRMLELFVGDDGVIGADMYGRGPRVFPTALHRDVTASPPPVKYPRSPGVYREWIDACKGRGAAGSSFDEHAGPLTEVVLLGNLAVRSGAAIEWDAERMRVSNAPEANAFLDEEYRAGWSLR